MVFRMFEERKEMIIIITYYLLLNRIIFIFTTIFNVIQYIYLYHYLIV